MLVLPQHLQVQDEQDTQLWEELLLQICQVQLKPYQDAAGSGS